MLKRNISAIPSPSDIQKNEMRLNKLRDDDPMDICWALKTAAMADVSYDFEWDVQKANANLKKHGVTFEQAASVFLDALSLTVFDEAQSK